LFDLTWERSIPIIDISHDEVNDIFADYDNSLIVDEYSAIRLGCRNSNYAVSTDKGKYLLRLADINGHNNETLAYELVKGKINVPGLLFNKKKNNLNIFIYEYIDGISLQKHIIESGQCGRAVIEQTAKAAAVIHNIPEEKTTGFMKYDLPPYEKWFALFLDNPVINAVIGEDLHNRIQRLVADKQKLILDVNNYRSFIHCDFRPANMLIDADNKVFFVDWEGAGAGQSLADIGQFFRYRSFFDLADLVLFEKVYNEFSIRKLPENWPEMSLLIDLINPLQMLSYIRDETNKAADLINVIAETLNHFEY